MASDERVRAAKTAYNAARWIAATEDERWSAALPLPGDAP
jgi:hypothetical protein